VGLFKGERGFDVVYAALRRYQPCRGGGIDEGENQVEGYDRELTEETGAQNIRNCRGIRFVMNEFRPWNRDGFMSMQMKSYC